MDEADHIIAIGRSRFSSFSPQLNDLRVINTTRSSLTLEATVNFTNPTKYTAEVPYADINILVNDTVIGHGTVRNISVNRGNNTNIPIQAVWEPSKLNGTFGASVASELISQYLSGMHSRTFQNRRVLMSEPGYNTSLTFKPHEGTIPSQPWLGKALESLAITLPTPRLGGPSKPGGGNEGDQSRFIQEATMHLFTSTATFILNSPLTHTVLDLTHINATAFYKADAVGQILYDGDIEVPPGKSETPKLPVDWSFGSVGYDAIKRAVGGTLKLKAFAHVGVRIGKYEDRIWYRGRSVGVKVRP